MKKTELIELEMKKQSYIKKLNKIESQIAEIRKGECNNDKITRVS